MPDEEIEHIIVHVPIQVYFERETKIAELTQQVHKLEKELQELQTWITKQNPPEEHY